MKIVNDQITLTAADFAGLSDFGQKAVVVYLEDYAAYFSAKINAEIQLAKDHLKKVTASDPVADSILAGLASADEAKLLEAQPLLAQLDALLKS